MPGTLPSLAVSAFRYVREGFDVKVLREILRLRKQDKDERDEQELLLDLYLRAMESAGSSEAKAA